MKFSSDVVIGMECHVELATKTKLFCSCSREGEDAPNTRVCPVCLGQPGSKPVLNKAAVEYAIKLCLALGCDISKQLIFSRKSYFYPDLAKNYQISQYELPLGNGGTVKLPDGRSIRLKRVHIEEDPASLVHLGDIRRSPYVLVDYNRSGNALCEIVSEPELTSPKDAREFMNQLITILEYLEIFDVERCILKADANISVRQSDYIRVEIKNVTGFKEIERALNYEILRQLQDISEGKEIKAETRGWDALAGVTYPLRSKESEDDYGYILDPDLVVTDITNEWKDSLKKEMPELADDKLKKFLENHKIEETTAKVLAKDRDLAKMYENVSAKIDHGLASKWIRRELPRVLNYRKKTIKESGITSEHLIALLTLVQEGQITDKIGQRLLEKLAEGPFDVSSYVVNEGLAAKLDEGELESICRQALKEAPKAVAEYRSGKLKSINFIVGMVMKKTSGKARPDTILKLLDKIISS